MFSTIFKKKDFLQKHRDALKNSKTGQGAILTEIQSNPRKQGHWMWWAFPINLEIYAKDNLLVNAAFSSTTKKFALTEEAAEAYIKDETLRAQLVKRFDAIRNKKNIAAFFGEIDLDKLNSSIKFFSKVAVKANDKELLYLLNSVNVYVFQDTLNHAKQNINEQKERNNAVTSAITRAIKKDNTDYEDELKKLINTSSESGTGKDLSNIREKK